MQETWGHKYQEVSKNLPISLSKKKEETIIPWLIKISVF